MLKLTNYILIMERTITECPHRSPRVKANYTMINTTNQYDAWLAANPTDEHIIIGPVMRNVNTGQMLVESYSGLSPLAEWMT